MRGAQALVEFSGERLQAPLAPPVVEPLLHQHLGVEVGHQPHLLGLGGAQLARPEGEGGGVFGLPGRVRLERRPLGLGARELDHGAQGMVAELAVGPGEDLLLHLGALRSRLSTSVTRARLTLVSSASAAWFLTSPASSIRRKMRAPHRAEAAPTYCSGSRSPGPTQRRSSSPCRRTESPRSSTYSVSENRVSPACSARDRARSTSFSNAAIAALTLDTSSSPVSCSASGSKSAKGFCCMSLAWFSLSFRSTAVRKRNPFIFA